MSTIHQLITDHIDIWTAADTEKKSGRGRSSGNGTTVYGVKKLRELILELAVRGKLVPQDPNDEPASELLKKIQVEKAKLIAEGKIKKEKPLSPITDDEKPFDLPGGWKWARLSDLVNVLNGRAYKKEELLSAGTPVIRVGNLFTSEHWYYSDLVLEDDKYCDKGDLLFAWSASFGPFIWEGERAIYHYHIWKLDLFGGDLLYKEYLYTFLLEQTQKIKSSGHGVMMIHMTKEKMEKLVVYLPPVSEQHRIVAKVYELMALCDQLETQHINAAEAHEKLVSQLLATLTQSQDAEHFSENWQRIAAHFDTLFTTEASVDALKQTLLQLAVMGKLVPQELNDETGSELLTRIQKSRADKRKIVSPSEELVSSATDWLPKTWSWASVDQLSSDDPFAITDGPFGANLKTSHYVDTSGHRVVRLQNIGNGVFIDEHQAYITAEHFKQLSRHEVYSGDLVVAGLIDTTIRCCQIPEDIGPAIVKADCYRFSIHSYISARYVLYYLISPIANEFASIHHHGLTLTRIGLGNFRGIPVPLPPAKEQARIVAKVEELMVLCDQLKSRITEANRLQQKLADVVVEQALA